MCKAFLTMPPYCRDRQNVFLQYFDYGIWALQRLGGWLPARARLRDWCLKYQPDFPYLHEQPDMENALMRARWNLRAKRDGRGRRSRSKWEVGPPASAPASALPEPVSAAVPPYAVSTAVPPETRTRPAIAGKDTAPSAGPPVAGTVTPGDDRPRAPADAPPAPPPASAPPPRGFRVPWIREKDRRPVRRRQADIEFDVFDL